MKYNIQLVWVFDGPRRPWKRNKRGGGGRPQDERKRIDLTCQLLNHLKVPHHRGPAEAEAECARMQRLGIVDAVWSDDSDTLMFGATCMLSAHKEGKNWSTDKIRVVQAAKILADHDLDHESLVAWAMLSGGDHNTTGLPQCGPQIARLVSRKQHGIAHELCQASEYDLPAWRSRLEQVLREVGKWVPVPATFPDSKALGHYCRPVVTPDDELHSINYLKGDWDPKIDQAKLRVLLRRRFNIWTKGFMKHVAPVFMIRQLARCPSRDEALSANLKYDIQLKKTRQKKASPGEVLHSRPSLRRKSRSILSQLSTLISLSHQDLEVKIGAYGRRMSHTMILRSILSVMCSAASWSMVCQRDSSSRPSHRNARGSKIQPMLRLIRARPVSHQHRHMRLIQQTMSSWRAQLRSVVGQRKSRPQPHWMLLSQILCQKSAEDHRKMATKRQKCPNQRSAKVSRKPRVRRGHRHQSSDCLENSPLQARSILQRKVLEIAHLLNKHLRRPRTLRSIRLHSSFLPRNRHEF